jgi:prepilin-type N-terminal cleavage/methylation domain-containing protein
MAKRSLMSTLEAHFCCSTFRIFSRRKNVYEKTIKSMQGFTLTEVMIVMAIIGVLLTIMGMNYRSWNRKVAIERQVREMRADLMHLRINALYTKLPHRAILNPSGYVLKCYNSEDEPAARGTVVKNKTLIYPIQDRNGNKYDNYEIAFNSRGITEDFTTITVAGGEAADAGVNCITVHYIRTNIGMLRNGKCSQQ